MIVAKDIVKRFGAVTALNGVDITIPTNSIFGLLGPNGAGKTTFIRILTRIYEVDGGTVTVDDKPLEKVGISNIGYMPEERGLYKKMKVGEMIIFMAKLRGLSSTEADKRMQEWFHRFKMVDWENKRIDSLSKGMQQKVQFIISVIHRPQFLILDEPFSGLDPVNAEALEQEIVELHKQGTTIILSTHDMNSVERFCKEVVLIDKGQVVLSGTVDGLKQSHRQSIYEFCCRENVDLLTERISKVGYDVSTVQDGDRYTVRAKFANADEADSVLTDLVGKIRLTSFNEILPSMNDLFIESVTSKSETL